LACSCCRGTRGDCRRLPANPGTVAIDLMTAPGVGSDRTCAVEELRSLEAAFSRAFGDALRPEYVASAPGRVNLIGEHTDYNDGFVFPIAIDRSVHAAARARPERAIRVVARDVSDLCEFSLDSIRPDPEKLWSNYIRGVALELAKAGVDLVGADLAVGGDLPIGAGVSSSAALELCVAKALLAVSGASMPLPELSRLCRRAENDFVGVGCGIMDQYICGMGERGTAMLLDCRSLEFELVPMPLHATFVVCDTGKARELGHSAYNERRSQCETGASHLGLASLRDATLAEIEKAERGMDGVVWRRCRHVVTEIDRALKAAACLKAGDLAEFGSLMDESHRSLREDYEVSCRELDVMVDAARRVPGCHGARLTGAGFGGCAVAVVDGGSVEEFIAKTAAVYEARTGLKPSIYPTQAGDGASISVAPEDTRWAS
jgi:galactokinase